MFLLFYNIKNQFSFFRSKMSISAETDSSPTLSAFEREMKIPLPLSSEKKRFDELEPLCMPGRENQLRPMKYPEAYALDLKMQAAFWLASEVNWTKDREQFNSKLNPYEQNMVLQVLSYFATSDNQVMENLEEQLERIKHPEIKNAWATQAFFEGIHVDVYSRALEELVSDKVLRAKLQDSANNPITAAKFAFVQKWVDSPDAFIGSRLLAFAFIEALFFSASFAILYWIRSQNIMDGLTFANSKIQYDEWLHVQFSALLYSWIVQRLTQEEVYAIVKDAVRVEHQFIDAILPRPVNKLSGTDLKQYVCFQADEVLTLLGYERLYKVENPLPWSKQGHLTKTDFFAKSVAEYNLAVVSSLDTIVLPNLGNDLTF